MQGRKREKKRRRWKRRRRKMRKRRRKRMCVLELLSLATDPSLTLGS